tara:strand:- start:908 stop:1462 length:555 start_codon:yes stop_codon:yes gene_type:complete
MKKTGKTVYLSGEVSYDTADAVYVNGGKNENYFQNIMTDERKGYAYKVTFVSMFPTVGTNPTSLANSFAVQTFTARELRKASNDTLALHAGKKNVSMAADNRTVAVCGITDKNATLIPQGYQVDYVTKGDHMVTEALSLCVEMLNTGQTDSKTGYYIELDEYTVSDNEEILLILNERAQDAGIN